MIKVTAVKFPILLLCVRSLGLLVTILVLVWNIHYRGGLALFSNNKTLLFNVHPVVMVIGLLLLNGEAMLAYKTVSGTKAFKKLVHLILQFLAFVFGVIGLWAAWKFHNDRGIDNFYSLHSWLGVACLFLFAIQDALRGGKEELFEYIVGYIHAGDMEALANDAAAPPRKRLCPEPLVKLASIVSPF